MAPTKHGALRSSTHLAAPASPRSDDCQVPPDGCPGVPRRRRCPHRSTTSGVSPHPRACRGRRLVTAITGSVAAASVSSFPPADEDTPIWVLLGFVWVDRALRHGCMALKSGRAAASRRVLGFCGHDPDSCDRFGASESARQPMPGFWCRKAVSGDRFAVKESARPQNRARRCARLPGAVATLDNGPFQSQRARRQLD